MFGVLKKTTVACLIVAALVAPAAHAQLIDPIRPVDATQSTNSVADPRSSVSSLSPTKAETSSHGFDWGDAGIGGAAVFTLMSLGAGAVVVSRRGRDRRSAATA
jgi:hypothetical protein